MTPATGEGRAARGPIPSFDVIVALGAVTVGILTLCEQFAALPGAIGAYVSAYGITRSSRHRR